MTIGISEKPSLLAALLAKETQGHADIQAPERTDRAFAGRLDSLLAADGREQHTAQATAQTLAESLKLQMLHSSLALAGDQPAETAFSPLFGRQSAAFQSLVKTYGANLADSGSEPVRSTPSQPLPELTAPTAVTGAPTATLSTGNPALDPIIARASSRYGVDAGLIKAVIKTESNFNATAVSHAGAQGLMQLMPGTARALGVSDSFDPEQNIMAGTRFLRDLLKRYNGDLDSALAAYNWGPGNVDKRPDSLPQETRNYLVRVKQLYSSYTA